MAACRHSLLHSLLFSLLLKLTRAVIFLDSTSSMGGPCGAMTSSASPQMFQSVSARGAGVAFENSGGNELLFTSLVLCARGNAQSGQLTISIVPSSSGVPLGKTPISVGGVAQSRTLTLSSLELRLL